MKHLKTFLFSLGLAMFVPATMYSQRRMTPEDLASWKRISKQELSPDGKWAACKVEPWEGDATVRLFHAKGGEVSSYTPAAAFTFSASSRYILITQVPAKAETDSLKVKKVKKEKMPMNTLLIRHISGKQEAIDSLNTFVLAEKADWIAYKRLQKDSTLHVRSLDGTIRLQYPKVSRFVFAKESSHLLYVTKGDSASIRPGLYLLEPEKQSARLIKEGKGEFRQISLDETGRKAAFLYCEQKDSVYKNAEVWLAGENASARLVADKRNALLPAGWTISEHGTLRFSKDGNRLFFGMAPEAKQKDSTVLAENRPLVEVWKWDEHTQYTVQHKNKANDLKKSYQAVYNIGSGKLLQLTTKEIPDLLLSDEANAGFAIVSTSLPYPATSMWEGKQRKDYYTVSLETGERKLMKRGISDRVRLSPEGKYAFWYAGRDSSWYAFSTEQHKEYRLTTPQTLAAWNEDNDVPDFPNPHGVAGWTKGDKHLLLYDRYDIWKADPQAASPLKNLTLNGRKEKRRYNLLQTDSEKKYFDESETYLLGTFDERAKTVGYYTMRLKPGIPKERITGNFKVQGLTKAKEANVYLYTKETFEDYPEVYSMNLSSGKPVQLTNEGEQQKNFHWGTAELVSWTSLDGVPLEGILCKPAGFDPKKKYPMIVNFYERSSDELHNYRTPSPHRSTIDYHLYTGNDYIIFNPDVRYKDGHPGESCYNCVMPGIDKIVAEGYVDEKAIAAQGHSWGGYQVAYLATRTNRFAAIESGAPVVNMLSAYGGIRWGTGLNRSFQYEHGQSRIGSSPWESPSLYVENSPLFTMDKVQTPILIMHNDNDGHVPWYQGIEYFIALKRLQKPVWMLNYPGEIHWPERMANRIDFQKRMFQFFNHYLKKEPMPRWMSEGVPAVEQDFDLGY